LGANFSAGGQLKKISEYRRHAVECREMMKSVSTEQRAILETMAQTWEVLAADRERLLQQSERIAKIENQSNLGDERQP
jgi:hypothetical protein